MSVLWERTEDPEDKERLQRLQIHWLESQMSAPARWWRNVLWLCVLGLFAWLLLNIDGTLVVFGLAWLIAYLLNPAVQALHGRKLGPIRRCSRGQAIAIVYILLVGFLAGVGSLLFPQVLGQLQRLDTIKDAFENPVEFTQQLQRWVETGLSQVPEEYRDDILARLSAFLEDSTSKIGQWIGTGFRYLANFVGQIISGMFVLVTGLIISIYILQTWSSLAPGFVRVLPPNYRRDAEELSAKMNLIFGGYLKATIITCAACFLATFLSLGVLALATGVSFPYIYLVSFIAGITYPIPVLGILASTLAGGVLGFLATSELAFAFWVAVVVNVVNNIIDRTIQPRLMSDAIGVSPLFVMFGAFAGGELMGVWGMLLGIPLAAMAKALFTWFHGRFLVDPQLAAAQAPAQPDDGEGVSAPAPAPEDPAPRAAGAAEEQEE